MDPKEWSNPEQIRAGFLNDRTHEFMQFIYNQLPRNVDGSLKRFKPGDWDTRQGCTKEPLGLGKMYHFTITHKVNVIAAHAHRGATVVIYWSSDLLS